MDNCYLSPKSDIIFKRIFGDEKNVDILSGFLQAVLDIPEKELSEITIVDPNLRQDRSEDKLSILDLKLKTSGGITIDVEVQLLNLPELKERIVYYTSRMITDQLSSGVSYSVIERVISIIIADFKFVDDSSAYHHTYHFYDKVNDSLFTNLIEIVTLELPKLPEQEDGNDIWEWAQFFKAERKEDFDMLAVKNKQIGKAVAVLAELSQDERTRLEYEYEEKARRDHISRMEGAEKDGILKVARNMKKNGFDTSQIVLCTNLTEDEINKL